MNFEEKINELEKKSKLIIEEIEKLKKEKEELEKPKDRFWKPKLNEEYLYLSNQVEETSMNDVESDCELVGYANCYRISEYEIAEKDAAKNKARQIIQRTADELHGERYKFVNNSSNFTHFYYRNYKKIGIDSQTVAQTGAIYFETKELAEKCLELCESEYKILLEVE